MTEDLEEVTVNGLSVLNEMGFRVITKNGKELFGDVEW